MDFSGLFEVFLLGGLVFAVWLVAGDFLALFAE